ncbi:hypothetical protein [Niabella ginsengisoli]|uniref:Lipoprotein n=1 Tax=Niabella ginsengisoli TaxID=522298 RepID=A0ABS9SJI7_9BACT|nr:hypothetical protein [Niabella ginsengisoli]MCH5598523.1 hypothetical protein [Niabella ginsengisoli]
MKSILKVLGVAMFATLIFSACSKDDDPANNDLFAGTYKGSVSYSNGDESKSNENGSVFVTKVGDRYDFKFSDGIPAITNVTISEGDGGYIGTVNGYTGFIRFNANNLNIAVGKDGATWTSNGDR